MTAGELLARSSTQGLANSVVQDVAIARAHGLSVRIDEMNSLSCGGQPGVSDSIASALWSLDALFQMARVGVGGVNIHTTPGALDALFTSRPVSGAWAAAVRPEYYGLVMFAQAVPPGSTLLRLSAATGDTLRDWATLALDGQTRIVLINTDPGRARRVHVRVARASGSAGLEWLDAPSVHATTGVTLAGQSFGAETTTARLAGPPPTTSMTAVDGHCTVTVPPGSSALLTLPKPSPSPSPQP